MALLTLHSSKLKHIILCRSIIFNADFMFNIVVNIEHYLYIPKLLTQFEVKKFKNKQFNKQFNKHVKFYTYMHVPCTLRK